MRLIKLFFIYSTLFLLGCSSTPKTMQSFVFDNSVTKGSPSNAIIISVAPKEIYPKLNSIYKVEIPTSDFSVFRRVTYAHAPDAINGKPTALFSATFGGIPIDGEFKVEVLEGKQRLFFYHADGYSRRNHTLDFNAKRGHTYFTKYIVTHSTRGSYMLTPIVFDLTSNTAVQYTVVSDSYY